MLRNKTLFVLLAAVMIVSLVLAGCGPKGEKLAKQINLNLGTEPPTLDPGVAQDTTSTGVDELLFLGLTDYDDQTIEVVPELAEKWECSSDGLTWTFHMRKDVNWVHYDPATKKFEKKRPLTAQDVVYGVLRALDPATASPYAYVLYYVKNAEEYNTGKVTDPNEVGIKAPDDYTIVYTLKSPAGFFPGIAGLWTARAVPKEVIEQYGDKWTEPGNIWTNGAYALDTWEHNNKMVLVKNPYYYDAKNVSIEQINYVMVQEQSTAFAMYENGELDEDHDPPLSDLDRIKTDPELSKQYVQAPELCTYYYGFNTTKPPFDNKLVRQAFSYALDRQKLIDTVLKGGQKPAKTFACPGIFGSPAEDPSFQGISFDPAKAKELLAQAGYPDGKGLPEITLMFNTSESHQAIAQFAQRSWKENLGVDVKLTNQEWAVYLQTVANDAPQIFRMGWCTDYPDENNWVLENFHSTKSKNQIRWNNPEFDKAVDDAAAESDPAKRKELYKKAEQILCVDEAAIIPVYYYTRNTVTKPYVVRTYSPLGIEHINKWKVLAH